MARYRYNPTLAYAAGSHPAYYSKPAGARGKHQAPKDIVSKSKVHKNTAKGNHSKRKSIHCPRCEDPRIKKKSDKKHITHSSRCPKRTSEAEARRAQKERPQKLHDAKIRGLKLRAAVNANPIGMGYFPQAMDWTPDSGLTIAKNASIGISAFGSVYPNLDPRWTGFNPWDYHDSTQKFYGTGFLGWGVRTPEHLISGNRAWGKNFSKFDWDAFEWAHFGTTGRLGQNGGVVPVSAQQLEPWHGELVDGMCWRPEPANGRRLTVCYYDQSSTGAPLIQVRPEHMVGN